MSRTTKGKAMHSTSISTLIPKMLRTVGVLGAIALVLGIAGCSTTPDTADTLSAEPSAEGPAPVPGTGLGYAPGRYIFPDDASIDCLASPVDIRYWAAVPGGSQFDGVMSLTESYDSCASTVDEDGDGYNTAYEYGDTMIVTNETALLRSYVEHPEVADTMSLGEWPWATCNFDNLEVQAIDGWAAGRSCVGPDGTVQSITHLMVAKTEGGKDLAFSCRISPGPQPLEEKSVASVCDSILDQFPALRL